MRRVRRALLILGIVLVLAFAYRVLGVYEFRSGECAAMQPRRFAMTYPKRLTVMTFNIEGHASLLRGDHIEEIAAVIRKYDPDLVAINEAHRHTWQARFDNQVGELARLTGLNVVFGTSYRFIGGDFGNAVLTRGVVVSSDVHKLPGTGEPRTLLESIVRINGGVVQFYVTHTAAWSKFGAAARDAQLGCINAHVRASSYPYIVAGDLNAPPDAPEMKEFLGSNALLFAGDPKVPTHRLLEQRLDYILIDPGWQVRSAIVLDDGPSDHRPVFAELTHE
jgi:endonuclease/exonuclease/phosphatase family metal-dependent hydrolase